MYVCVWQQGRRCYVMYHITLLLHNGTRIVSHITKSCNIFTQGRDMWVCYAVSSMQGRTCLRIKSLNTTIMTWAQHLCHSMHSVGGEQEGPSHLLSQMRLIFGPPTSGRRTMKCMPFDCMWGSTLSIGIAEASNLRIPHLHRNDKKQVLLL